MPLPFWSLPLTGHFSLRIHQPGRTTQLPMLPAHTLPVYCIYVVPSEAPHHHSQPPSFYLLTDACSSSGSARPIPSPGAFLALNPSALPPEHPCFLPPLPTHVSPPSEHGLLESRGCLFNLLMHCDQHSVGHLWGLP